MKKVAVNPVILIIVGILLCCYMFQLLTLPSPSPVRSLHQIDYVTLKEHIFIHHGVLTIVVRPQDDWLDIFTMEILLSENASQGEIDALSNHMLVNVSVHWNMEWCCAPIEAFDSVTMEWYCVMKNGAASPRHYPI